MAFLSAGSVKCEVGDFINYHMLGAKIIIPLKAFLFCGGLQS